MVTTEIALQGKTISTTWSTDGQHTIVSRSGTNHHYSDTVLVPGDIHDVISVVLKFRSKYSGGTCQVDTQVYVDGHSEIKAQNWGRYINWIETELDITDLVGTAINPGEEFNVEWQYIATSLDSSKASNTYSRSTSVDNPRILISWDNYTKCKAPTSISISDTKVAPNASCRLSWSGAEAGLAMDIDSYSVYRSSDNVTYTLLESGVENEYLDVNAPNDNNAKYYYKVVTVGSVEGFDSDKSTVYAELECHFTNPSISDFKINSTTSGVYSKVGDTVVLSWRSVPGENNDVESYKVYLGDTVVEDDITDLTYEATISGTPGTTLKYKVMAVGQYGNSSPSVERSVSVYSDPGVIDDLVISASSVDVNTSVNLTWTVPDPGALNSITGYTIFRSTSVSSGYAELATVTGTSYTTVSPANMGGKYYYKVRTNGSRSNSALSGYVSVESKVYTVPTAPTSVTIDNVEPDPNAQFTISWTGASSGTNNPITGYRIMFGSDGTNFPDVVSVVNTGTSGTYSARAPYTMGARLYFKIVTVATKPGFLYSSETQVQYITAKTYTACLPATIAVSDGLINPDAESIVSWSGSMPGTNNPITGYKLYRSRNGATYVIYGEYDADVNSVTITAGVSGTVDLYKVVTVGTKEGYDSASSNVAKIVSNSPPGRITYTKQGDGSVYESGALRLEWSAAQDIDNNLSMYVIEFSKRVSGEWSAWVSSGTTSNRYIDLQPSVERGELFKYRVKAEDELGLQGEAVETIHFKRNTLPQSPEVICPANNAVTFAKRPNIILNLLEDQENQQLRVMLSVDGGPYTQAALSYKGKVSVRPANDLQTSSYHTFKIKVIDSLGGESSVVERRIYIDPIQWDRQIARGTVISNPGNYFYGNVAIIPDAEFSGYKLDLTSCAEFDNDKAVISVSGTSHQNEVKQMYERVNRVLVYYGIQEIEIPDLVGNDYSNHGNGKIGMFADWGSQMIELEDALKMASDVANANMQFVPVTQHMAPTASVIASIRNAIENL